MNFKNILYISLFLSFLLLVASLAFSYTNITNTNNMLKLMKKEQIKLSYLSNKLNYAVKENQSKIYQSIILKTPLTDESIYTSFKELTDTIQKINAYIKTSKVHPEELSKITNKIRKRIISYKAVQDSLIEAIKSHNDLDIQDATIGLNSITIKFSQE